MKEKMCEKQFNLWHLILTSVLSLFVYGIVEWHKPWNTTALIGIFQGIVAILVGVGWAPADLLRRKRRKKKLEKE